MSNILHCCIERIFWDRLSQLIILSLDLPVIPVIIISIPIIRNATEIIIANNGTPTLTGCTIIITANAMLMAPTPIPSALKRREALLLIP